jgi:hypothetical protein
VLRASAACEAAGIPSSSLVAEGFINQAKATSIGLGVPNIPLAMMPGHPAIQADDVLRSNILGVTLDQVIGNLTRSVKVGHVGNELGMYDVVCKGSLQEVHQAFIDNEWSDGLPIIPPTIDLIEAFLRHTDRPRDEVLGILLPDSRFATVWSVAVNGVMAGCKPEYMPVLLALVEAMADPDYGVEHSGNTPGSDTLIILNGPITQELGFNVTQGVMRDGFQANTTVGRFWRLYLRNIAGFLPHRTDKATFGNTWRVVVPENEDVLKEIGWPPLSVDMGFSAGDNTVTISRFSGGGVASSIAGSTPERLLRMVADGLVRQTFWQICFTMGVGYGTLRPLALMSPIIAHAIAAAGWSKQDVKNYLFEHARMPAWEFERLLRDWVDKPIWNLQEEARLGNIPADIFAASDDPNRLVPIVWEPNHIMLVVTGDPARNSCYVFGQNGQLGFPVTKRIRKAGES